MRLNAILFFSSCLNSIFVNCSDSSHSTLEDGQEEDFFYRESQERQDFIPLPRDSLTASSTLSPVLPASVTTSMNEMLLEESVYLSISCETGLGSNEISLKTLIMNSLDFTSEETFLDLERPACRALFDSNAAELSKEQIKELMSTERGLRILQEGEALEFFVDFSDFTLEDLKKFPDLHVGKIRNLSSISPEVLLSLIHTDGFSNAGRLERIPELLGERVLGSNAWKLDLQIWQLFTLEGITQSSDNKTAEMIKNYALFLANQERFDSLIMGCQKGVFDNFSARTTKLEICKSLAKHAGLLARWVIQSEEFLVYLIEIPNLENLNINTETIKESVKALIKTRNWLKWQLNSNCHGVRPIRGLSEVEKLHLDNLTIILDSPMTWRLKEALRFHLNPNFFGADPSITPMTKTLANFLINYPEVILFFRDYISATFSSSNHSNEQNKLLAHFFLVNDINKLEAIFETPEDSSNQDIRAKNEKLVLSIAIRRILLMLLSPNLEALNSSSLDIIRDTLNYVFTAQSPVLATSNSVEVLRWFRQARDLQSIPVLDRLIRNFGHEFDVRTEICSMLSDSQMRMKLFVEAQSAYVKLIASLGDALENFLIEEAPCAFQVPYLDPANALQHIQVPALPVHPQRRPHSEEEINSHAFKVSQVQEHNARISESLKVSLRFLQCLTIDPKTNQPNKNLAGFIQPNFRVQFSNDLGIDAGGLRRTWLSAVLRMFGDSQRMLFPCHLSGGRTPSALLAPEIMGYLGALHGKSLQSDVKPDWFFVRQYSMDFLFAAEVPEDDEQILRLVENLFPDIFGLFDSILRNEIEVEAVEFFNSSEFPSIVGLTLSSDSVITEIVNESVSGSTNANNNETENEEEVLVPSTTNSPLVLSLQFSDSQFSQAEADSDDESFTDNVFTPSPTSDSDATSPSPSPLRHSFSKMLVFDIRYLGREEIYNGPRAEVNSRDEILIYRTALAHLFYQNLQQGRLHYHRAFHIFFKPEFYSILSPEFLHNLLEPPMVTIEEVMTRIKFNKACDTILVIDDESQVDNEIEGYDENVEETSDDVLQGNGNSKIRTRQGQKKISKKARSILPKVTNISARTAFLRILSSSFQSPKQINSLLSFSTGCPQLPPAGLDALRLNVNCFPSTSAGTKLSKSHTCSSGIDFRASANFKVTKEAFIESVISSSGFGFN